MDRKKEFDLVVLGKILRLAVPYKALFVMCLSISIIMAPITTIRPFLISQMVDNNIFKGDLAGLKQMAMIYFVVVIVNVILRYIFIYYSSVLGQSVIKDLRVKVFQQVSNLRLRYLSLIHI